MSEFQITQSVYQNRQELRISRDDFDRYLAQVAQSLEAEVKRLRDALEFYAEPLGWVRSRMEIGGMVMAGDSPCECDQGETARAALANFDNFVSACCQREKDTLKAKLEEAERERARLQTALTESNIAWAGQVAQAAELAEALSELIQRCRDNEWPEEMFRDEEAALTTYQEGR